MTPRADGTETDVEVADGSAPAPPWWHAPWRLLLLGAALAFLVVAISLAVQARTGRPPGAGSVDVGFLQDMRYHHDQAVQLSLAFVEKPAAEQNPVLRTIAHEILLGQQLENGAMVELLQSYCNRIPTSPGEL